jgi:hypothetical protein
MSSLSKVQRPGVPFFLKELLEVEVAEGGGCVGPGSTEPGAVGVAAAKAVCTTQGHNLPVIEAHAVEYVAQMLSPLHTRHGEAWTCSFGVIMCTNLARLMSTVKTCIRYVHIPLLCNTNYTGSIFSFIIVTPGERRVRRISGQKTNHFSQQGLMVAHVPSVPQLGAALRKKDLAAL